MLFVNSQLTFAVVKESLFKGRERYGPEEPNLLFVYLN